MGRFLRRFVLWRVGIRWYLFALLGVPLIMVLGAMVYTISLPNLGALWSTSFLLSYVTSFALVLVVGGPLLEEPGWRGFALPRLEHLHGPLVASLVLGVLWSLWHGPLFVLPAWSSESGGGSGLLNVALYVVGVTFLCIIFTWVFNNTQTSILLAILVHTSNNVFNGTLNEIFPPEAMASALPTLIGYGVTAVVLVVLTRGRLSYERVARRP